MKYQKSPIPYLLLLIVILSTAVYSTATIDKQVNQPTVYSINKDSNNTPMLASDNEQNSMNITPYTAFISK